jgi:elongation factor G
MPAYDTHDIRNVALVGHAGSGKTLLTEALLAAAGAIKTPGELARGTTVSDHDPQEKKLAHSVQPTACHMSHLGKHINLLDTPGSPDLMGRAMAVLPAVETVAVVMNGHSGIELGTRRMMEAAAARGLCRMVVVNHIDEAGGQLEALLAQIQDVFGPECLPVNLPAEGGGKVLDCFFARKGEATDFSSVEEAHRRIIEQVVEEDDALMELYLEEDTEPTPEQLHDPFEKGLREGHLIPICFVSAETGAGVPELLDIIAKLAPDPTEANPAPFMKGEGEAAEPVIVTPDPAAHAVAHVFRVLVDPYMGRVSLIRIHQGTVRTGGQLFIGDHRKPLKLSHLYKVQGKDLKEVPDGIPGDICAIAKVEDITYDMVLHDSHDEDHHHMRSIALTPPMVGVAIEPARRGNEAKLSDVLHKLVAEDPSVDIRHAAGETAIYGMGELHLKVILDRMKTQGNLEVTTKPVRIPYRETITQTAEGHYRHKKQTGGAGQFGEVYLRIEPLARGEGFEFKSKVVGGAISQPLITATEKGIRELLEAGAVAGYPMQDMRVVVYDGKMHAVDSKEIAFMIAGRLAFKDAVAKARPIILEPIVDVHIEAPAHSVGTITGDISSMRGRILRQDVASGGMMVVEGQVPLAEVAEYHTKLKSHTGGEGSYNLHFSHYEPVPIDVQRTLASSFDSPNH